jgi:hypothetical protein
MVSANDLFRSILGRRRYFLLKLVVFGGLRFVRTGFRLSYDDEADKRREYPDEGDPVFLNNMFLLTAGHVLGLRPIRQITASRCCAEEGAGYQTLMRMRALAFARAMGLEYVHTPLFNVAHADRPMERFAAEWEALFGLAEGHRINPTVEVDIFDFSWGPNSILLELFDRRESFSDLEPMLAEFRRRYRAGNDRPSSGDPRMTVCVHVRRGDVGSDREDMWTGLETVGNTLRQLAQALRSKGMDFKLQIISQGSAEDLLRIVPDGLACELCLDEDPFVSLRRMVDADILVIAKSNYSYLAGVISEGIKLIYPSVYAPLSGWIVLDETGGFDAEALQAKLAGSGRGS